MNGPHKSIGSLNLKGSRHFSKLGCSIFNRGRAYKSFTSQGNANIFRLPKNVTRLLFGEIMTNIL